MHVRLVAVAATLLWAILLVGCGPDETTVAPSEMEPHTTTSNPPPSEPLEPTGGD